jgi:iron complex outermembrane receptor protein
MKVKYFLATILLLQFQLTFAQHFSTLEGKVYYNQTAVSNASITVLNTSVKAYSDSSGNFEFKSLKPGNYTIYISAEGFANTLKELSLTDGVNTIHITLQKLDVQLNEVVVSADKFESDLQKTPISISVFDANRIESSRIWNTKDLAGTIPNLYAGHSGDYRNVTSIRGITTTSYDPAVATYIDGVNQFGLDTYISQLNDIERIEVLRGPQGTLYGRNATAGVINIITKQPDNQTKGFLEANFGNFKLQRYTGGIKAALVPNKLFFGAAGMFTKQDGFFFNEFTNSSYDDQSLSQGNYFLRYKTNNRLSFLLNVKHQLQLNKGAFPLVSDKDQAFEYPFQINQNQNTQMRDKTFNASLSANYQHDKWTLNSQSSYQENYRFYEDPIDGDFSSNDIISVINNYGSKWNRTKAFIQEIRLSSPVVAASKLKWQLGAYGFFQDSPVRQGTYYGSDAGMYGSPLSNFTDISTNNLTGHGLALFGQADYQLTPDLSVIVGLRYDFESKDQQIKGEFLPDGGEVIVTRSDTSSKAQFNAFSPKLALSYQLADNNNLYASYSRGFRAGGISQLSSDPSQPPLYAYDPEYSNNFEVGSKNEFLERRLKLNVALFYAQVNNAQVPTLVMPDALTLIRNAGELSSKGAEIELSALLLRGLDFDFNFGYTDATYNNLALPDEDESVNLSGNRQIFTPKTTSLAALQYTVNLPKTSAYKLSARLEWKNLGEQYFDLKNTIKQEAYNLLNTRLSVKRKNIEVALWASNIMDETYISYAYNFGAVHLGNPRTYGLTLRSNF